jgi:hypothetical protein
VIEGELCEHEGKGDDIDHQLAAVIWQPRWQRDGGQVTRLNITTPPHHRTTSPLSQMQAEILSVDARRPPLLAPNACGGVSPP